MSRPERSEPMAPERADSAIDWPCARLSVAADGTASATMYAPGLPPGNHDVWCLPVASAECARWKRAIAAVMPEDFKDWHENSDEELPAVAAWAINNLRTRMDELEQVGDRMADLLNRTAIALRGPAPAVSCGGGMICQIGPPPRLRRST